MKDFEQLVEYAKVKVELTQTPANLYGRAQFRKNAIDSLLTIAITSLLLALSTTQMTSKASVQPPAVKKFIQQELVAARGNQ